MLKIQSWSKPLCRHFRKLSLHCSSSSFHGNENVLRSKEDQILERSQLHDDRTNSEQHKRAKVDKLAGRAIRLGDNGAVHERGLPRLPAPLQRALRDVQHAEGERLDEPADGKSWESCVRSGHLLAIHRQNVLLRALDQLVDEFNFVPDAASLLVPVAERVTTKVLSGRSADNRPHLQHLVGSAQLPAEHQ